MFIERARPEPSALRQEGNVYRTRATQTVRPPPEGNVYRTCATQTVRPPPGGQCL